MRTTIRLDDDLLREARQLASATGRTLSAVVEDALRAFLARRKKPDTRVPARLIHGGVGGLLPGVYLDHTAELVDRMEGRDSFPSPRPLVPRP